MAGTGAFTVSAGGMEPSGNRRLRAKYHDWCSARLAERFLDLTPEEIYQRARPAVSPDPSASPPSPPSGTGPTLPSPTNETYRELVQRVTDSLLEENALPTFEQWADAYAQSPRRFDAELLGLWKELEEDPED